MSTIDLVSPEKEKIQEIFDTIAPRYDFLNNFLSFRQDEKWRQKSIPIILDKDYETLLDLGVGTGKYLRAFLRAKSWRRAAGLDFSKRMLEYTQTQLPSGVELYNGDFHDLPFKNESFELIVSSFTLRSVKSMDYFLTEVYRILRRRGKAAFLCLTRPKGLFYQCVYKPYLQFYIPLVGRLIGKHQQAYQFLSSSIQSFQDPEKTAFLMEEAGFHSTKIHSFSFGAVTLIEGEK